MVYKALHLGLSQDRAIKKVPKQGMRPGEAHYLKTLRHPGIPILYDIEEDESFLYLIEEYLQGCTLYDLVLNQGTLLPETVFAYGKQICEAVHYLHSAGNIPVLYLDLQPKNLMVCEDAIKLIDFDCAANIQEANQSPRRYGSPGFFAPEQESFGQLDERTDVYAIGKVLFFMSTGHSGAPGEPPGHGTVGRVIRTCLCQEKEGRYASVRALWEALLDAEAQFAAGPPLLTVGVSGSRPGVGATHLALGLCSYLRSIGLTVVYEEENQSGAVDSMSGALGLKKDRGGCFNLCGLALRPYYGKAVDIQDHPRQVTVRDFGHGRRIGRDAQRLRCDADIILCGGQPWERDADGQALAWAKQCQRAVTLYRNRRRPGRLGIFGDAWEVPYFTDPFGIGGQVPVFYEQLWAAIGGKKEVSLRKSRLGRIFRKTGRKAAWWG
jgi:serine/threonine-protein kinase